MHANPASVGPNPQSDPLQVARDSLAADLVTIDMVELRARYQAKIDLLDQLITHQPRSEIADVVEPIAKTLTTPVALYRDQQDELKQAQQAIAQVASATETSKDVQRLLVRLLALPIAYDETGKQAAAAEILVTLPDSFRGVVLQAFGTMGPLLSNSRYKNQVLQRFDPQGNFLTEAHAEILASTSFSLEQRFAAFLIVLSTANETGKSGPAHQIAVAAVREHFIQFARAFYENIELENYRQNHSTFEVEISLLGAASRLLKEQVQRSRKEGESIPRMLIETLETVSALTKDGKNKLSQFLDLLAQPLQKIYGFMLFQARFGLLTDSQVAAGERLVRVTPILSFKWLEPLFDNLEEGSQYDDLLKLLRIPILPDNSVGVTPHTEEQLIVHRLYRGLADKVAKNLSARIVDNSQACVAAIDTAASGEQAKEISAVVTLLVRFGAHHKGQTAISLLAAELKDDPYACMGLFEGLLKQRELAGISQGVFQLANRFLSDETTNWTGDGEHTESLKLLAAILVVNYVRPNDGERNLAIPLAEKVVRRNIASQSDVDLAAIESYLSKAQKAKFGL